MALAVVLGAVLSACGEDAPQITMSAAAIGSTSAASSAMSSTAPVTTAAASTSAPTATTFAAVPSTTTTIASTSTSTAEWWRPVTADSPLRVWVAGDSLAGPLGGALAARAAAGGMLDVTIDQQKGTGLVRDDLFAWPGFAAERLAEVRPEVVVIVIGANDGQAIRLPGGSVAFGTPEWDGEYGRRVGAFMDLLAGERARVYWVGIPIMAEPGYDARVRHLNAVQLRQGADRPQVAVVDAYSLFQDADGLFAWELAGDDGSLVAVRLPDGIHLTAAGAGLLARRVLARLATDFGVPALGPG